ncbi:hypothetical protein EV586_10759 [Tumebacillus sp. BK434]|uniref:hypothetical protein n=1 Tax=Tumebacillus sp. BK434 TaxID=2512169 RepID=UPI001048AF6C|nr:hypothetical protein [Tumebacillus sp. BK434]TCP52816.1 hypothetical protein EV586_10759 [Tumebacillus sp. BK434]
MYKHVLILQKNACSTLLEEISADPTPVYAAAVLTIDSSAEAVQVLDGLVWEHVILAAADADCIPALEVAAGLPGRIAGLLLLNPPEISMALPAVVPTLVLTTGGHVPPAKLMAEHFRLQDNPSGQLREIMSAFLTLRVA